MIKINMERETLELLTSLVNKEIEKLQAEAPLTTAEQLTAYGKLLVARADLSGE